jgi:hypothetical protein
MQGRGSDWKKKKIKENKMGEIDGVIISDGRTVGAITADVIAIVRLKGVFYKAKVLFGFGCVNFLFCFGFFFLFCLCVCVCLGKLII